MTTNHASSLIDWTKDHLEALYQIIEDEQSNIDKVVDATFTPNATINYNHATIDLAKLKERLSNASFGITRADIEWKEIIDVPSQEDKDNNMAAIVAGYFIVTRSMKFRIRAAPAQRLETNLFSAKIVEEQDGQTGDRRISELFLTSANKQAPIRLQGNAASDVQL